MGTQSKKDFYKGCQNEKPGGNPSCKVKLRIDALKNTRVDKLFENKLNSYEN